MTAVNLTHQPAPQNHHSNYNNSRTNNNDRRETCEVGLNLSLQNGMNLSVRQAYYYNEGDFETNYTAFEQQTTTQQQRTNQSSTVLMPHEAHRYSPLNLEHRSSPLNLTSKFDQNQYFNFSQENYQNYNSSSSTTNLLPTYPSGQSMPQPQNLHQSATSYYYEQQPMPSTSNGQYATNFNSQQNSRNLRLFCSTCQLELPSSNMLNKHMEKHNSQLENVAPSTNSATSVQYNNKSLYSTNKSYGTSDFSMQDSSSFDNVMNFSCDKVDPTPSTSTPIATAQPSIAASQEKVKIPPEMPAIVSPNNSTKKKLGEEPKSICSECSLVFPTGQDLKKHIDLVHFGRKGKNYQCIQCAKEFDDIPSHKLHMEIHMSEKPFKCTFANCGLHFTNNSGLKRHIKRIHEKIAPIHECPHCSKGFHEKFDLVRHLKSHSAPRCDKCKKLLPGKDRKHICKPPEKDHDPDLKCTICGHVCENKINLGVHMWKHTKDVRWIQTKPLNIDKTATEEPISLKS